MPLAHGFAAIAQHIGDVMAASGKVPSAVVKRAPKEIQSAPQSSTFKPGTRLNSRTFAVTSVAS